MTNPKLVNNVHKYQNPHDKKPADGNNKVNESTKSNWIVSFLKMIFNILKRK
jgi:hypothetical protein